MAFLRIILYTIGGETVGLCLTTIVLHLGGLQTIVLHLGGLQVHSRTALRVLLIVAEHQLVEIMLISKIDTIRGMETGIPQHGSRLLEGTFGYAAMTM